MANPRVVIIAGPNGAGKTTASRQLLQGALSVNEFVNADAIAYGLSAFRPEAAAMEAGRVMLTRLKELAAAKADFAFETTLASRHFAKWIRELGDTADYEFSLVYLWLPQVRPRLTAKGVGPTTTTVADQNCGIACNRSTEMIQRSDTAEDLRDAAEDAAVDRALYDAAREAIQRHKRAGNSIVMWRDDQIVEIPASAINVDE